MTFHRKGATTAIQFLRFEFAQRRESSVDSVRSHQSHRLPSTIDDQLLSTLPTNSIYCKKLKVKQQQGEQIMSETRAVTRDIFSATIGSVCCCYVGQPFDTGTSRVSRRLSSSLLAMRM